MRRFSLAVAGVLLVATVLAPTAAAAPPAPTLGGVTTPISVTVPGTGAFNGQFTLDRFTTVNGALTAVGTLTGTVTDALGGVVGVVNQPLQLSVISASGTCDILHLTLGPLDLDLLGLVIHLDQIVLDITAESGPGNLLGNLLCAVAGLLDSNAPTNLLARLLNQLLGLLG